ncbi:cytochrome d ubiquinol oxidase subunit II [Priestia megaterium]|uniref:Cytochrome d ubiquinol oxidase, subunit II n=1 Tax=Priestia megaterium (strain ATCC 14581 / DSM 32 / CCUG 1817 / JCM 2506 / NBRC 15308 / NCIMB 9376 / NCTC 10342 / NRRL B-14308 / VKM B-512 / Ford 19) TaxID=1348623 RepID=A0A0B6AUY0_PRIM2|nr:cytochrome d ubiquinol oxidase subunit II [Priestia megaterium]AJI23684.1 cytochrome d ubiquinol oxidase, subunit II [Priestia megaterium NBRC 15308 = ATCC 14581]KFN06906.1 cytochrome d ubiquinol oxidase, subunit II [Priestia megaterium]KGJ85101.1 cytochrome d ubiquinol oxidase subunit 2 [Priestia megaterium NBRC 15308 = ATCC 14581]MDR4233504.1 cytochrome d ubiquinol oxidase subunit II [Priestia megaterium]MED3806993.1 cytochrome d ubiquinol oxidase subunit II [Priestia megaterium]
MFSLNEFWYLLVSILFVGFIFLEGFDFGIGMVSRFLGRNDLERRAFINTIGPFWDANEVWLISAIGAMFAAFPNWYATLLSGSYVLFVFLLLSLIGRGVAFEFRGKVEKQAWKNAWDWVIFFGSLFPPLIFGILFSALMKGLPVERNMQMNAGFSDIVNLYTITGGVTLTMLCLWHGLIFATIRTMDDIRDRSRKVAMKLLPINALLLLIFSGMTFFETDLFSNHSRLMLYTFFIGIFVYLLAGFFLTRKKDGWAFAMSGLILILSISSIFAGLFPTVLVSSINQSYSLTIHNAASGNYSLKIMSYAAIALLPFVLGYQIWSYYVFRKRVDHKEHMEY